MVPDIDILAKLFTTADLVAVVFLLAGWLGIGVYIERMSPGRPSMHRIMQDYRLKWMEEMSLRDNRIFDANILSTLRAGASFFGSACMIAIGGGVALLGQTERLATVAGDLAVDSTSPRVVWEAKILLVLLLLASAFLKFVWSHRLFGYCAVLMAAVPQAGPEDERHAMAMKAGHLNINAARNFNRGLRTVYFGLASLTWLLGPWVMMAVTCVTLTTIYRREFASPSREVVVR